MIKIILTTLVAGISLMASVYNLENTKIDITKNVHCVIGDFNPPKKSNKGFVSNMCYVDIGDSIVVLDAGPTYIFAKEFTDLIKKDYPNKKISSVVLSNFHDDRTQGIGYFQEQGIIAIGYKNINKDIKNNGSKFERYPMLFTKKLLKGTTIPKIDKLVDDGYTIRGSKKSLKILKLSKVSEEKSDIVIWDKDDSFVFTGNIVFNGRMLNFTKNSNIDGWIKALEGIKNLNAKYILGGHGKEFDSKSYLPSLNYLTTLKKDVKKAYDSDVDTMDIKLSPTIYEKNNIPYFKPLNRNNINNFYDYLDFAN
ncbi:beta lactamase precursor [hydrothermal vent metagenome]|uniref:Beta lactamase n=1 Tax=hydrothermal vent metagenome TaxID=652676 RepID=A0A3B1E9F3_9ZZZZ